MLGAYLGRNEDLLGPGVDNPEGFWENKDILDIHERLLQSQSRFWHDIRPLPDGWWDHGDVAPFKDKIAVVLSKNVFFGEMWAWKDPRTAITLPLWQKITRDLGICLEYVICVRNPIDVALSLHKIHGFSMTKSIALWQLYNLSALYWTNGSPRIIISYDDVVQYKEKYLVDILTSMREVLSWPKMGDGGAVTGAIISDLRHYSHGAGAVLAGSDVPEPVRLLYTLITKGSYNQRFTSTRVFCRSVDRLYRDYDGYVSLIASALS